MICSKCRDIKPVTAFQKGRKQCRDCINEVRRERHAETMAIPDTRQYITRPAKRAKPRNEFVTYTRDGVSKRVSYKQLERLVNTN